MASGRYGSTQAGSAPSPSALIFSKHIRHLLIFGLGESYSQRAMSKGQETMQ